MAVVIRLQGLRTTAGSEDIRNFFSGLKIPDGGVHIIGGKQEEAFIIFASDEDARRAMVRSGGCIKGSPVNLLLSSKSEMQSILEESARTAELEEKTALRESSRWIDIDVPGGGRRADNTEAGGRSASRSDHSPVPQDRYLFLKGMEFSVTEMGVSRFFHGSLVDDIILVKNARGQNNGTALVKFATKEDARDGLKKDKKYLGSRYVEIFLATEDQWRKAGGHVAMGDNSNGRFGRGRSPVRSPRQPQRQVRSRSPLAPRSNSPEEFCVLLENLSYGVEKRHIKELFRHARLEDEQILYLLDNAGRRTRSVFVLFTSLKDYAAALTHHKEEFVNCVVHISPISREKMMSILESSNMKDEPPGRFSRFQERPSVQHGGPYDSEKVSLYVRNMPFDVRKVEIMDFFVGFNITEDKVILLRDHNGVGLGEALVIFRDEREAMNAQALNGQRFLGSEVMLKCVSRSQMQDLGIEPPAVQEPMPRLREEKYLARSSEASYHPGDMDYPDLRIPPDAIHGGSSFDPDPRAPRDAGNGSFHGGFGRPAQQFDGPTRVKLENLPVQIKKAEIYDFCYGYRVVPGSVYVQYVKGGRCKGTATVVFESHQEALTAVRELSGRPIGQRKIQLVLE